MNKTTILDGLKMELNIRSLAGEDIAMLPELIKLIEDQDDEISKLKQMAEDTRLDLVKANRKNIELFGMHDDMRKERNVWADRYLTLKDGMQKISAGHWSRGEYAHFASEQLKKAEAIK